MAQRRMVSLEVVDTDAFLDMPVSSQLLYFHLNARADDDGFVANPKRVLRSMGGSDDDLRLLVGKKFLIAFQDGVCVIKHWRINNFVRKDIYKETQYLDHRKTLFIRANGAYTLTEDDRALKLPDGHFKLEDVDATLTSRQPRLGKGRIDTVADAKGLRIEKAPSDSERKEKTTVSRKTTPEMVAVFDIFDDNPDRRVWKLRAVEREAAAVLYETFGLEELKNRYRIVKKYRKDPLCPNINKPSDLLSKMPNMEKFLQNV